MSDKKNRIVEIFNNMSFEPGMGIKSGGHRFTEDTDDFTQFQKNISSSLKTFNSALEAARKAEAEWRTFPAHSKSNLLRKVARALANESNVPSSLKFAVSILINYFDFYSDLVFEVVNIPGIPCGIVRVILPPDPCFFTFGAIVSGALTAGCPVIVDAQKTATLPLFLEETMKNAGLPDGIFNVTPEVNIINELLPIYSCHYLVQDRTKRTAALVLESCDLNSAVAEIFKKSFAWESDFWILSTVVVQESISQEFLEILKFHMDHSSYDDLYKYKDEKVLEKINNGIMEAVKSGATVLRGSHNANKWGPTALVGYQNQGNPLPILKVLVCRTGKEGAKFLNEFIGTSIWSECSAQALEIASELECLNIWINCHGVVDAQVHLTWNAEYLGGRKGLLKFFTPGVLKLSLRLLEHVDDRLLYKDPEVSEILLSAKKAYDSWRSNKNKRMYFESLATCLENTENFSDHAHILTRLICLVNHPVFPEKSSTDEFFLAYQENTIGVVNLLVSSEVERKSLLILMGLLIASGNAVVLVTEKENQSAICLANCFKKSFPKNLVTVVHNRDALPLYRDPIVQAFWMYEEEFLKLRRSILICSSLWLFPKDVTGYEKLILTRCTKSKVIWLPKVEKFP